MCWHMQSSFKRLYWIQISTSLDKKFSLCIRKYHRSWPCFIIKFLQREMIVGKRKFSFARSCLPVSSLLEDVCGIWDMFFFTLDLGLGIMCFGFCLIGNLSGSSRMVLTPTVFIQMTLKLFIQRNKTKVVAFPISTPYSNSWSSDI